MDIIGDITSELELFFSDLNWRYIFIYSFILYGIKYKRQFDWYNYLFNKHPNFKSIKEWIAGFIILILFCIFTYLEGDLNSIYVSELLRSYILVIIFTSIISDRINKIENKEIE